MSYFNWANPFAYSQAFSQPSQAFGLWQSDGSYNAYAGQPQQTFTPQDYTLPSSAAPKSIYDQTIGKEMELVGLSSYFDVSYERQKGGYNWQGTRVDVYKTNIPVNSIYFSGPYVNPVLPAYQSPISTAPYILSMSQETYESKMIYDKNLGRYVQRDKLTDVKRINYADALQLGAPDTLTERDIDFFIERRDYYSGAMIGGKK